MPEPILKIGLACDDYKVSAFEKEIRRRGLEFEKFADTPAKGVTFFSFHTTKKIGAEIATKVELSFHARKSKYN